MCGLVGPVANLQFRSRAYVSNAVDGVHASNQGRRGTFHYNGNVTAGDPKCRTGSLGGVPRRTQGTVTGKLVTVFLWSFYATICRNYRLRICR